MLISITCTTAGIKLYEMKLNLAHSLKISCDSPSDSMDQAEGGVGHAHRKLSLEDELVDAFHVFLSSLHHEGWNPQDAVIQQPQTLHEALTHRIVQQAAVHTLNHRRIHGGEV